MRHGTKSTGARGTRIPQDCCACCVCVVCRGEKMPGMRPRAVRHEQCCGVPGLGAQCSCAAVGAAGHIQRAGCTNHTRARWGLARELGDVGKMMEREEWAANQAADRIGTWDAGGRGWSGETREMWIWNKGDVSLLTRGNRSEGGMGKPRPSIKRGAGLPRWAPGKSISGEGGAKCTSRDSTDRVGREGRGQGSSSVGGMEGHLVVA